jgi:HEAT repeat protein
MVARSDLGRRAARNTPPFGPAYAGRMRKFEPGYEDPALLLAEAAGCPDSADERRARLIGRLQRRSDAAAFLAAAEAARAADLELRLVAVEVLGQLGYASERPYREETLPILLGAMDQAVDPRLLETALNALAHLGDGRALTPVLRHAEHRDDRVRRAVAFTLPSITDQSDPAPEAVEALIVLSEDADEATRDWATFGLAELLETDTPEVRAALSARLGDVGSIADQARAGLVKRSAPAGEPGSPQPPTPFTG